ncbi:MAG: choice-of-anchor D domain-containing protein, partial [Myxococcota bacterium]|nr:choice-of-anchor D domain-containing protein [Myxococcota bacterium]
MNRHTLLLATSCVLAMACNEYELVEGKDAQDSIVDDSQPDIAVDPASLDFGDVFAYDTSAGAPPPDESSAVVTISNEGEGDLLIQDIELQDGNAAYTLGSISSVAIASGGTATFTVTFAPETSATVGDTILISSNDPDEGVVEIPITGNGIAPSIQLTPSEYDFGTLYIGCDGEQAIEIANVGNADLVVDAFEFNTGSSDLVFDPAFGSNDELPWTISPGDAKEVYVNFTPFDEYDDVSYLFVSSNDPYTPEAMALQEAAGALYGTNVDLYEQPIKGETDIIFAVDRSCSMNDDIENVQNNFGVFMTTMASLDADFHVAATVEDNGCINGSDLYIDNTFSASDAQSTITTMINLGGSYGSNTERAFTLLEA